MKKGGALLALVLLWGCSGEDKKVRIDLPLPPKLDLTRYDYLYFPGFIADIPHEYFDTDREAVNFFKREISRRDVMGVIENAPADLSEKDPRSFFGRTQPFFKSFNFENSESTLALTGVISFESVDRSGFQEVDSMDYLGRRVKRVEYVEVTGFNLNMKVFVYDLNGRLLYRETLMDSTNIQGSNPDERLVFYDLLQRISDRVLGLFANTHVKAERSLL